MEWIKFYYNGHETNIEATCDGKVRRIKTDWCQGRKFGDVDFSKLKSDMFYYQLKVMVKDIGGKKIKVHQIVASIFLNYTFNGYKSVVDHIDSNTTNNHVSNLRVVSHRENMSKERTLKSGTPVGVHFRKDFGKYQASIKINGIKKCLGSFVTKEDAEISYKNALNKLINHGI
jgi:hypothetical protein